MNQLDLPPHLALPLDLAALLEDMPLELLAFTPVTVRARHNGWSPDRQRAFILRLALLPCVSKAARAVGKSARSAYQLRERPDAASFAAAWDLALTWGEDRFIDATMQRALYGETVPIMQLGKVVGQTRRFDNRLAMAVLRTLGRRSGRRLESKEFIETAW